MRWTDRTLLFGICVMWGLSFSVIKIGLREVPPLLRCAIRFTLVALPAVFFRTRPTALWLLVMPYGLLAGSWLIGEPMQRWKLAAAALVFLGLGVNQFGHALLKRLQHARVCRP